MLSEGASGRRVVGTARGRGRPARSRAPPAGLRSRTIGLRRALPPVRPLGLRGGVARHLAGPDRPGGRPGCLPSPVASAGGVRPREARSGPSSSPWSTIARSMRSGARNVCADAPSGRRTSSPRPAKTLRRTSSRTRTCAFGARRFAPRSRPFLRRSNRCSRWRISTARRSTDRRGARHPDRNREDEDAGGDAEAAGSPARGVRS